MVNVLVKSGLSVFLILYFEKRNEFDRLENGGVHMYESLDLHFGLTKNDGFRITIIG